MKKQVKPPLRPHIRSSNFDPEYKQLKIDDEYYTDPVYDDTAFEGFEYSFDIREENKFQYEASNYSNLTNTTAISLNNSRGGNFEESRKNRSEVWSTEYSRNEEMPGRSKIIKKKL